MPKISLNIGGMDCASCAQNINHNLKKQRGVISSEVYYVMGKADVEYDENLISLEKIKEIIKKTGYKVLEKETTPNQMPGHSHLASMEMSAAVPQKNLNWQMTKTILAIIFTIPLLARMLWKWELAGNFLSLTNTDWAQIILTFAIVFIFGAQFHKSAGRQIVHGQFSMDSLISLGTLTAFFYSLWAVFAGKPPYFETASAIAALILLGKYLEVKTQGHASDAMKKLMELGVKKALIVNEKGEITEKNIEEIKVGEISLIKPGEKIPLDGIIIEGSSDIDESMLTGEGLPVAKREGENAFGGTINKDGQLKIKITQTGANTILAKIIKTVEEAQNFKAPMQRLADKISGIFVPAVIGVAFLTFIGWFFYNHNFTMAIINAVTVLIISCPCALGLATPIAVMVGTSVGAKKGILIKNGESFEKANKIDTVIFDKTGTLTLGEPKLYEIIAAENFSQNNVSKIAAALASGSTHPLSQAIAKALPISESLSGIDKVSLFTEYPGRGIGGEINHQKYFLGNQRILTENKIDLSWAEKISREKSEEGGSLLFLAEDNRTIAAFLLRDELKKTAAEAVQNLKKMRIESMIISGDREAAVHFTASLLAVDNFFAEVLPSDKQKKVKELQDAGKKVVFAGDGINDAPSLVQADLGIAMGAGADIAKEAGNIIIMKNEPKKIVEAIKLSRKTFNIIKQNLFWAFFYNIIAIPLAIFGIANPIVAALAMTFSDLTVIGNSLRIYKE
jgi:Cu+-exporting ATPase